MDPGHIDRDFLLKMINSCLPFDDSCTNHYKSNEHFMEAQIETEEQKENTIAVVSYLTLIGLIIAYVMNQDKKSQLGSYHIRQSLGLLCCGFALGIVGMIPILGWIVTFVGMFMMLYMWIMGLINAMNKKEKPLPFLGKKIEEWFKGV